MRRDKTGHLTRSQKTVWYYPEATGVASPPLRVRYRYFELLQPHMLIEDVHNQILPYIGFSQREPFSISLMPTSKAVEGIVASALDSRDRRGHNELVSSATDFFRECAQSLVTFGEVVYELVYLTNPEDAKIVQFEFESVRPMTVSRRRGQLVQAVPKDVVKQRRCPEFINLQEDRILIFKLSAQLRRSLDRTLEALGILSEKLMPEFALQDLREATSRFHYDSAGQVYSQKLALAEAGKAIGWNARGLFNDDMLEFYTLRRQLSFEKFKIELRNSILKTLNVGLQLAGKEMGFSATLHINGLPTVADVEMAESELELGSKAFGDVLKPFLR